MQQVEEDGVVERWGGVGRWKNKDGAMPDGNSEMVRVVSLLEGELEEDQGGDDRQEFRKQVRLWKECREQRLWQRKQGRLWVLGGSQEGEGKTPEALPTLRQRRDSGGELGGHLRSWGGCAHGDGGVLGGFPAPRAEASGVSSERLFSIHGATQSLPHLLSTASPVI